MKLTFGSRLGGGASGYVWAAKDPEGRSYAVKFFRGQHPVQQETTAFEHASALARCKHPGVVGVISVELQPCPEDGAVRLAIIMEHVQGPTLDQLGKISRPQGALIGGDLIAALEAIHNAGVVHGDIHFGNVLIGGGSARIIDIYYTYSLRSVSSTTRAESLAQDARQLAALIVFVLSKAEFDSQVVSAASASAVANARTATDLRTIFMGLIHERPQCASRPPHVPSLAAKPRSRNIPGLSALIDPEDLVLPDVPPGPLTGDLIARLEVCCRIVQEFHPDTEISSWLSDFARERDPERELEIYEEIARVITWLAGMKLSSAARREAFDLLIFRSGCTAKRALATYPLICLSRRLAREILRRYRLEPRPVGVELSRRPKWR